MPAASCTVAVCAAAAVVLYGAYKRRRQRRQRVLVVGSINIDLYQRTIGGAVRFGGESVDVLPLKVRRLHPPSLAGTVATLTPVSSALTALCPQR